MDRSNKATLPRTIPRSLFKSSAKDLALENLDFGRDSALGGVVCSLAHCDAGSCSFYSRSPRIVQRDESLRSSTDSDLEAFSHNPTDGSFAPLTFQPSANANCLNLRFLSY